MKTSLIVIALSSALASAALAATPNTYTCSGQIADKNFSLAYGAPAKSGQAVLALNFNNDSAQRFAVTDKDIVKSDNIFGKVVGMIIETQPGVYESWSMVVPKMSLRSVYNKVLYEAVVMRGVEVNGKGSMPNYRQSAAYLSNLKTVNVSCLAALHVY